MRCPSKQPVASTGRCAMSEPSRCRSCQAPIIWAVTAEGRKMPVDAAPHQDGRLVLSWKEDGWQVRVAPHGGSLTQRHRPHFATCPDADSWRKR
jgi:hypothetical protein